MHDRTPLDKALRYLAWKYEILDPFCIFNFQLTWRHDEDKPCSTEVVYCHYINGRKAHWTWPVNLSVCVCVWSLSISTMTFLFPDGCYLWMRIWLCKPNSDAQTSRTPWADGTQVRWGTILSLLLSLMAKLALRFSSLSAISLKRCTWHQFWKLISMMVDQRQVIQGRW